MYENGLKRCINQFTITSDVKTKILENLIQRLHHHVALAIKNGLKIKLTTTESGTKKFGCKSQKISKMIDIFFG